MTNPDPVIRLAGPEDIDAIINALGAAKKAATGVKSWVDDYSFDDGPVIADAIVNSGQVDSVVVDETFLFCYRVGLPWFGTPGVNLEECLILRIYPNKSTFDRLVQAMEIIARDCGCIGIHVQTDFASSDAVQKKYQRNGFRVEGVKLFKGVPHG